MEQEKTHSHCCRAEFSSKVKAGLAPAVLQDAPETEEPTVSTSDVPPDAKPVASDIVRRNSWVTGRVSWNEYVPVFASSLKAESGREMLMGTWKN